MVTSTKHLIAGLLSLFPACLSQAATSATRGNVTWTWTEDRQTGTYCSGDPWVVGPITLTATTPAASMISSRVINGTQINPRAGIYGYANGVTQGWDSTIADNTYSESANIGNNLPLEIADGSSVMTAISLATPVDNNGHPQNLSEIRILTVVSSAPASGSFRPPYQGPDKSGTWNESQINYGVLRSLAPVTGAPGSVPAALSLPWTLTNQAPGARTLQPTLFSQEYGADRCTALGNALLALHLNFSDAQKRDLLVSLIQHGIDVYGALRDSRANYPAAWGWFPSGGHNIGQLAPMVLAGVALNNSAILAECDQVALGNQGAFAEIGSTFYVTQTDVNDCPKSQDSWARSCYVSGDIGTAEWGEQHNYNPTRDSSAWGVTYRNVNFNALATHHMFLHLLIGGRAAVNDAAFFAYHDRVYAVEGSSLPDFAENMYATYRSLEDGGDTTDPAISITSPTSSATYSTSSASVSIGGTASDNTAVTSVVVTLSGATTGTVTITGTTTWSGSFTANAGDTVATAIAYDAAGNASTSDTLTVTYTAPATGSNRPSGKARRLLLR